MEGDDDQAFEEVGPGDSVSIENLQDEEISISVVAADGTCLNLELVPGQAIELVGGDAGAWVILHDAEPDGLLVVKPDTP
jgi:hypothetical protein